MGNTEADADRTASMQARRRALIGIAGTAALFVLVQVGALAVVEPFERSGYRAVEDPSNPANSLVYFVAILLVSGVMLLAFRYGIERLIQGFVLLTAGLLSWYVLAVFVPPVLVYGGLNVMALAFALLVVAGLFAHPEWYVIDAAGVLMGAGAAGLFGISFGILPALVLLVALAVYDAISVYGTEHMLTLAEGAMDLRMPVLFIVPLTLSFSYVEATSGDPGEDEGEGGDEDGTDRSNPEEREDGTDRSDPEEREEGSDRSGEDPDDGPPPMGQRDALFVGLGDAVMPTILVVSAAVFVDAPAYDVPGLLVNLPALTAMVGTMVGLVGLNALVLTGRPQAGLPLLNGGAIAGYLVGALASGLTLVEALALGPYV